MTKHESEPTRRDFLYLTTAAMGTAGIAALAWPFIDQMNPSSDVLATSTLTLDTSSIEKGQQVTVMWRGKPVFVRRRTEQNIEEARAVTLSELIDPIDRNANKPGLEAIDQNRTIDEAGEWLVMIGICTHLGCVPLADAGDYGGWFCPCHGSHYDTAGRIRQGPAPENLYIPPASFIDDKTIKIG